MNFIPKNQYIANVIVTSDTCSKDPSKDTSGEYVVDELNKLKLFNGVNKHIVADDKKAIKNCIKSLLGDRKNVFVITVGGTGFCPRDVTPEATSELYERRCNGIETSLFLGGLRYSFKAALSRLTAGIVKNCLIVNFPGKLIACKECFPRIESILEHALEQINFDPESVEETHKKHADEQKSISNLEKKVLSQSNNDNIHLNNDDIDSISILDKAIFGNDILKDSKVNEKIENNSIESKKVVPTLPNKKDKTSSMKEMKVHSPYQMIDYQDALNMMKALSHYLCETTEELKLNEQTDLFNDIIGRYLAEDVYSRSIIPQFPCSTVDGYVMNYSSTFFAKFNPTLGRVTGTIVSNLEEFERLQKISDKEHNFFCYQINTGGRVPEKDFIVIPVEHTSGLNEAKTQVCINKVNIENNTKYIRDPGVDLNQKDFLKKRTKIGPVELSVIISMGHKSIKLIKKPHIGVLTTGDELITYHEFNKDNNDSSNNKVLDSNGPLLINLFKSHHYSVLNLNIVKDNPQDISLKIQTGFIVCDIIVITGGASMGSKDHVKDVVEQMGGVIHFGRVNIKPGKPAAFASIEYFGKKKFIFCLPGNPVSAYITTFSLVLPFIQHGLRSHSSNKLPLSMSDIGDIINVELAEIIVGENNNGENNKEYIFDDRLEFVRAKLLTDENGYLYMPYKATVSTRQQSSCLLNLLDCDCLIIIEPSMNGQGFIVGQSYRALKLKNC